MQTKMILSAVLFAVALAAVHPVVAGPKPSHTTGNQPPLSAPASPAPIRGDLHLFLKAF